MGGRKGNTYYEQSSSVPGEGIQCKAGSWDLGFRIFYGKSCTNLNRFFLNHVFVDPIGHYPQASPESGFFIRDRDWG